MGAAAVWWSVATGTTLPAAPPDAAAWYARGSDAVRQGAYGTGRKALEEAIRLFPDYALAHARLAEALSELDDERAAQTALIRVSALTPNQWLLAEEDRLRLAATRASVLRDHDEAIQAYAKLAALHPLRFEASPPIAERWNLVPCSSPSPGPRQTDLPS